MAELTRNGTPSLASMEPPKSALQGYTAGENIAAGDFIAVRSDGNAYRALPTDTRVIGFSPNAASHYEAVAGYKHLRMWYPVAGGLTPGTDYFLSSTVPGGLATAAGSGAAANPIAHAVAVDRVLTLV